MAEMMGRQALLNELKPTVEKLLERHYATSKEWFPHELVPFSRGRDLAPDTEWTPELADLAGAEIDDAVRSALLVNLLTEDNLPYYFRTVESMFGAEDAWGEWVRRWTAEEGRHSMAIYGYLAVTQAIDLKHLERCRMAQVSGGKVPQPETLQDGFIYLALQELATRISHRNTGIAIGDPVGYNVMARVASDENLHQLFYRDLAKAAIEVDPDGMMIATERQVRTFAMPGEGIPGFTEHAKRIAGAGIYDLIIHHDSILAPDINTHWGLLGDVDGLGPEGENAQEKLRARMAKQGRVALRLSEKKVAQAQVKE